MAKLAKPHDLGEQVPVGKQGAEPRLSRNSILGEMNVL